MFARMVAIVSLSTLVHAECIGEKFFKSTAKNFLPGLENVCFGMTQEQVAAAIEPEVVTKELNSYKKRPNRYPQNAWMDTQHFQNWFNDGGRCCFGNVYYPNWTSQTLSYQKMGPTTTTEYGISTIFVGYQDANDTNVAFTFYNGKSNKYRRSVNKKYVKSETVTGLFDITIKVSGFLNTYYTNVLDTIGYIRQCSGDSRKNCTENPFDSKLFVRTNDPDVIILFDRENENVHIRLVSQMESLADAMQHNVELKYQEYLKKYKKLDE